MSTLAQTDFIRNTPTIPVSQKRLWVGRILSGIPVLMLLMDGVMKLFTPAPVVVAMTRLGYPPTLSLAIGIVLLICVITYMIPQTSVLGAILLTGYLGGAVATHLRVGDPLLSHVLFPIYVGILLWAGLFLREDRLRALLPVRK
jgi:hypothetical protein